MSEMSEEELAERPTREQTAQRILDGKFEKVEDEKDKK